MDIGSLVARLTQFDSVVGEEELSVDTFPGDLKVAVRTLKIVGVVDGPVNVGPVVESHGEVKIFHLGSFYQPRG